MSKLLIGFLLAPWLCYGQNLILKGTITDAKNGTLLPYAYVQVKVGMLHKKPELAN